MKRLEEMRKLEKGDNWWKPIRGIGKARAKKVEEFFKSVTIID